MRKLYSFFILATFSSSLLCMDEQFRHHLVKEIMVRNITYLSHDSLCALALVDKDYNTIIQETVEARKNYFGTHVKHYNKTIHNTVELRKNYLKNYGIPGRKVTVRGRASFTEISTTDAEVTWHKHGSTYVLLGRDKQPYPDKLMLRMFYLMDDGDLCDAGDTVTFYDLWDYKCRFNFNRQGEVYLHGVRNCFYDCDKRPEENIIEYSLSSKYPLKQCHCFIELENLMYCDFGYLLEFPALVRAFLQSTHVYTKLMTFVNRKSSPLHEKYETKEEVKMYNIKGVTIPDDFKLYKERYAYKSFLCENFDQLPEPIKNAILAKYAEQQNDALKKEVLYNCDILFYITKLLCLSPRVQDMKETFKALSCTNKFFHNYYSAEKNQQMIIRTIARKDGCNDEAAASFFCYRLISEKINYFLRIARSRNEHFTEEDLKQTWYLNIINMFSNSLLSTTIWNQDYEKVELLLHHLGLDVGLNELRWLETLTFVEMLHHHDNNKELLKRIYDAVLHKKRLLEELKK